MFPDVLPPLVLPPLLPSSPALIHHPTACPALPGDKGLDEKHRPGENGRRKLARAPQRLAYLWWLFLAPTPIPLPLPALSTPAPMPGSGLTKEVLSGIKGFAPERSPEKLEAQLLAPKQELLI